jgi:hypothetical protein
MNTRIGSSSSCFANRYGKSRVVSYHYNYKVDGRGSGKVLMVEAPYE